MQKQVIPIFYACDDNFVKYTIVSLKSLLDNASAGRQYHVHILNTGISPEMKEHVLKLKKEEVEITFEDVTEYMVVLEGRLPIRDYYTKTTYYRLFIADMFTQYDKAIYIDSDTVVLGDIAELYDTDIGDNYVGACHEQAMVQVDEYGTYVEEVCGVPREIFFNAGMLLLNLAMFREKQLLNRFASLLKMYNFAVTQDEDYLNIMCKDRVYWLHSGWNMEVFGQFPCEEKDMKIIHYIMTSKPWHYDDCRLSGYFWKYAKQTTVYDKLVEELNAYTDEQKKSDAESCDRLLQLAVRESVRPDSYYQKIKKTCAPDRLAAVDRIKELKRLGIYDMDIEEDPPSRVLKPDEVDYLREKLSSKIKTKFSFFVATQFVKKLRKRGDLIIKDIVGLENFSSLKSGAIITCNHFNAFDSFAIHLAYLAAKHEKRDFYRVIREGNYTSFPGMYGFFMRNCNTLPLSSDFRTMKLFMKSLDTLLKDGHFVLVYPEQFMWWNYRKPRPLKNGAFHFAAKNGVPVLPCFITMRDSDKIGADGFPIQEYTIHIEKPIYPDENKSVIENTQDMLEKNTAVWNGIYEDFYRLPPEGYGVKKD